MSRNINKYIKDSSVTRSDSLIGSDYEDNKVTKQYDVGAILALNDNQFASVPLMYVYKTDDVPASSSVGIMNTDASEIVTITSIVINRYSANEEDMASYMIGLTSIISTYDVFLNIRHITDGEIHGRFKVSSIVSGSGTYTLSGSVQDGLASGYFEDGAEYFLIQDINKIVTASPETIQNVTWEELLVFSPKRQGDRFNVSGSLDSANDYGYITLDSSNIFTIINADDDKEIIYIV